MIVNNFLGTFHEPFWEHFLSAGEADRYTGENELEEIHVLEAKNQNKLVNLVTVMKLWRSKTADLLKGVFVGQNVI